MQSQLNVSQKLIKSHLLTGNMIPGEEIGLKIDQALMQDATGTLVQLELEAMGLKQAKTEIAVQYVDHNLLQTDFKNADDHMFLKSAAEKFGLWFSRPGNGVSHPVHMERFGKPGKTMVGSDSHTCAAGSMGMLAMGTGGIDVAMVIAGEPYYVKMPKIFGIHLKNKLPDWTSAKDVILEMLRRYDVKGGRGYILEYFGEGLDSLTAMDRHVIANMGAELGATSTVFPSDQQTLKFLEQQGRAEDWQELVADPECDYDKYDEIDLSKLEPLIACPSSPGKVVTVKEVAGKPVYQCVIGSSANPGYRDFWVASKILKGKMTHPSVSLDINPTSRQILENLTTDGHLSDLVHSGARIHQSGCMGCIGMGQAPATGKISLRTMPRNFPGRSGTENDQVYLCSPETAAASALTGVITDPRDLNKLYGLKYPKYSSSQNTEINMEMLIAPDSAKSENDLEKGPNIKAIPITSPLENSISAPVLLKMDDNISTDEILKAGANVLPFRSNIPEISKWTYYIIDPDFYERAMENKEKNSSFIVIAGENYAQGSSREHAALAPKFLGQSCVIAKSYARIGWQNLINFGIVPLEFVNPTDYDLIENGDKLTLNNLPELIKSRKPIEVIIGNKKQTILAKHTLSDRQIEVLLAGGQINYFRQKQS
ncbi:aconitate hydratase [Aureibacter tunicatorum]|uniref:Aconitate hydratase n=1 Tax=Aureibacter tunicatorum TaxID=866807 RepID=A0AAE3XN66_9BACT|nr:aconitate hydratase [Aureibacter tunicatorum]MDR6239585.1 aconitate hydratase [Aureibacter tunicatorum]BDD04062.1 aconitate hydratase [Aureibacter tunicatorum]